MSAAQVSAERPAWGAEGRDGPAEGARPGQPGSPGGKEAAESGGRREPDERRRQAAAEAPPPRENAWTKRRAARDGAADGQPAPRDPELENSSKHIKAAKPRTRKCSKAGDFVDIGDWPTPSETTNSEN